MRPRQAVLAITMGLTGVSQLPAQESASGCERLPRGDRAVVYGAVHDSVTSLPVQELRVQLSWEEGGRRRTQERQTGRDGVFRFCDAPANQLLRVEADPNPRTHKTARIAGGGTEKLDLIVDASKSNVSGRVVEHGLTRGIAAAEVRVRGTSIHAITTNDGRFDLKALPPGVYFLDITHVAYQPRQDSLQVTRDARLELTIGLAVTVVSLRPIQVVVRSHYLERTGFYERQERGFGAYLSRPDWEDRAPRYPSDILRMTAGVRVIPRNTGVGYTVLDRGNCQFRYVMDGTRVGSTFELDDIPIEWIEAIEIYRGASQIPPQFMFPPSSARANCGVIVIWTRNR